MKQVKATKQHAANETRQLIDHVGEMDLSRWGCNITQLVVVSRSVLDTFYCIPLCQ